MKKIVVSLFAGLLVAAGARANTPLTIFPGINYGCLQNAYINPVVTSSTSSFALPNTSGTGSIKSSWNELAPSFSYPPIIYSYGYTIDVSGMSSPVSQCITLVIHFGEPTGCNYGTVSASPSQIQSATLAPYGDISFVFNGGCLVPGQAAVGMGMNTETTGKFASVTVIDDYTDPQTGLPTEYKTNVPAWIPDIPPDPPIWLLAPQPFPFPIFQGLLGLGGSNAPPGGGLNGSYDLQMQLISSITSNAVPVTPMVTQTVQVVNGLFTTPLPFDPISMSDGATRWVSIGVRPSNLPAVQFTPITPLPISPAPQALYAYTAGAVADLSPGQAVTSLNGLTDAVNLQAGNGLVLNTNGNTLTIGEPVGAAGGISDRNLKTDFSAVDARNILAEVVALPIQSWRYTNEVAGVRHVGPMAQDFKAAFGLGNNQKIIGYLDEGGVALAAIKGLNQKLNEKDGEIQKLQQQNEALEKRLDELERKMDSTKEQRQSSP